MTCSTTRFGSKPSVGAKPLRSSSPRMMRPPSVLAKAETVSHMLFGRPFSAALASTSASSRP